MNNEKGRAFLLCMIGLFVLFILGWKHTETLSADDYVKESIGIVEISIVTPSPKYQQTNKEEYINFDLRNLAIVKKDNEDETAGSEGLQSVSAVSEADNEQHVEDGTGSAIDSQDPTGYEEDAEGTKGSDDSEGDTGDENGGNDLSDNGDGESLSELVGAESSDETGSEGWMETEQSVDEGNESGVDEQNLIYLGTYTATAYCSCHACCGAYSTGYTASGTLATEGRTVACNSLPFGTELYIDGYGYYIVEDTGWSPYEPWLDIFFESHDSALSFGEKQLEVYLVERNDG